jgi:hypothetical protein
MQVFSSYTIKKCVCKICIVNKPISFSLSLSLEFYLLFSSHFIHFNNFLQIVNTYIVIRAQLRL